MISCHPREPIRHHFLGYDCVVKSNLGLVGSQASHHEMDMFTGGLLRTH
jgi:hypothetical protein